MREYVSHPLWTTKTVVLADCSAQMRTILDTSICHGISLIGMLNTDGLLICIPVSCMPCCVAIPDELTDASRRFDLIMGRSLTSLPYVIAALYGEISIIVVNNDRLDIITTTTLGEVFREDFVHVCIEILKIHYSFTSPGCLTFPLR